MTDTRERLTTPELHRFIEGADMEYPGNRRAILVEGFGDVYYVEPAMRASTLDGVPVLVLRLHEPPETPHVGGAGNVGTGTACGSGQPQSVLADGVVAPEDGWRGVLRFEQFTLRDLKRYLAPYTSPEALAMKLWLELDGAHAPRLVPMHSIQQTGHRADGLRFRSLDEVSKPDVTDPLPSWGAFVDDRCAYCEHPSEDHQQGAEKCYTCPAARRCRRFQPKARR